MIGWRYDGSEQWARIEPAHVYVFAPGGVRMAYLVECAWPPARFTTLRRGELWYRLEELYQRMTVRR